MNIQIYDIMNMIYQDSYINQRMLAEKSGHSLGVVNKSLKFLVENEYLDEKFNLTEKAFAEFESKKPQSAVILAAGFGMRMVPINADIPKGLLEANGEILIERIIRQLNEVGIKKIYVIVGYLKEKFEYLIDEFGVELIVNRDYSSKNNIHSLNLIKEKLNNSYIIPSDIWCEKNPFNKNELYSWYMVTEVIDDESNVRVNRKNELVLVSDDEFGNQMTGISYLLNDDCDRLRKRLVKLCKNVRNDSLHWEAALVEKNKFIVNARVEKSHNIIGINTYEELMELDENSNNLHTDAIMIIEKLFNINKTEICDIKVLKKGMTNRSFLFKIGKDRYIMRIPGEGTDNLINRTQEAEVYDLIKDKNICDDVIYINPDNGYKITKYIENSRCPNPDSVDDLKLCMNKLKKFHDLKLKVSHEFDMFEKIDFYENLWRGKKSIYRDYNKTKEKIKSLKKYIDGLKIEKSLTHVDANADNFLFDEHGNICIIDWEYASMQDPHLDIAMFCIYSLYDRAKVDRLIDIYFENNCDRQTRIKIYSYIAIAGLLWSNWCEYKLQLGIEFGEYSLKQYRYAKEYYKIVSKMLED